MGKYQKMYVPKWYPATATVQDIWNATVDVYTECDMTEYLAPLKKMLQGAGHSLDWKGW